VLKISVEMRSMCSCVTVVTFAEIADCITRLIPMWSGTDSEPNYLGVPTDHTCW